MPSPLPTTKFLYYGPTNALEWYFALRVNLDMDVAATPFGPECGLPYSV